MNDMVPQLKSMAQDLLITGKLIRFDYILQSFLGMKQTDKKFQYKLEEYKAILNNFKEELDDYNHDGI